MTKEELNNLAVIAKSDESAFERLYDALKLTVKAPFMHDGMVKRAGIDAESVYNDAFMDAVAKYQHGNSFIGLLRLKLDSRKVDALRADTKRRLYEQEHVRNVDELTRSPQSFNVNSVEFRDFIGRQEQRIQDAFRLMLNDGLSLKATAARLGYGNMITLKRHMQKALSQYLSLTLQPQ